MGKKLYYTQNYVGNSFFSKIQSPMTEHSVDTIDTTIYSKNTQVIGKRIYYEDNGRGQRCHATGTQGNSKVELTYANGQKNKVTFKTARNDKQLYILNDTKSIVLTQSIKDIYCLYANPHGIRRKFWIDKDSTEDKMEFAFSPKGKLLDCAVKKNWTYLKRGNGFQHTFLTQCYQRYNGEYVCVVGMEKFNPETGEDVVDVMKLIHGEELKTLFDRKKSSKVYDSKQYIQKYHKLNYPENVCIAKVQQSEEIKVSEIDIWHPIRVEEWDEKTYDDSKLNNVRTKYFLCGVYGESMLEEHLDQYQWRKRMIERRILQSGMKSEWFLPNHYIDRVMLWVDATTLFNKRSVSFNMIIGQFLNVKSDLLSSIDVYHPISAYPKNILPVSTFELLHDYVEQETKTPLILGTGPNKEYHHFVFAASKSDQKETPVLTNTGDSHYWCNLCNDKSYQMTDHKRISIWYLRSREKQKAMGEELKLKTWKQWKEAKIGYNRYNPRKRIHKYMADPAYGNHNDPDHGDMNLFLQKFRSTFNISTVFAGGTHQARQNRNNVYIKMLDIQLINHMQPKISWDNWAGTPKFVHKIELDAQENATVAYSLACQYVDGFYESKFGKAMATSLDCCFYRRTGIKNDNIDHIKLAQYERKLVAEDISIRGSKTEISSRNNEENKNQTITDTSSDTDTDTDSELGNDEDSIRKLTTHTKLTKHGFTRRTQHNAEYHTTIAMDMIPNGKILGCRIPEKTNIKSKKFATSGAPHKALHENCMIGYNKEFILTYLKEGNGVTDDGELDPINGKNKLNAQLMNVRGTDDVYISIFENMRENPNKPEFVDGFQLHVHLKNPDIPQLFFASGTIDNMQQFMNNILTQSQQLKGDIQVLKFYQKCDFYRRMKKQTIWRSNGILTTENKIILVECIVECKDTNNVRQTFVVGVSTTQKGWLKGDVFQYAVLDNAFDVCLIENVECLVWWDHIGCVKCDWSNTRINHNFDASNRIIFHSYCKNGKKLLYYPLLRRSLSEIVSN
eukprot:378184_1